MQTVTERVLERFATDLGVAVRWSTEVIGLDQDDDGVTVTTRGPDGVAQRRALYVVGCDGGRSSVRGFTGIPFNGTDSRFITLLGDVELDNPPADRLFLRRRPAGIFALLPFGALTGESWQRVLVTEHDSGAAGPATSASGAAAPATSASGAAGPATSAAVNDSLSLDSLRDSVKRVAGSDFGMRSPRWLSRHRRGPSGQPIPLRACVSRR
jgi:2-polyprenyl-6-methoxyphenol hydroxylase-like FAD-dependent oxidoreductase